MRVYVPQRQMFARHVRVDLRVGRLRSACKQRRRAHDLPGLAVTALRDVLFDPGLLHGRQRRALRRQTLDRRDLLADRGGRGHLAGLNGCAVQVHRAGAALADAATVFRADQAKRVAQDPKQGGLRIDVVADGVRPAVDGEIEHACLRQDGAAGMARRGSRRPSLDEFRDWRNRARAARGALSRSFSTLRPQARPAATIGSNSGGGTPPAPSRHI